MSKMRYFIGTALAVVVLSVVGAIAKQPDDKVFNFTCVLFDHKDNQVVLRGHVAADKFEEWFKKDYPVAGERIETPKRANAFGTLVLTDTDSILIMPFYTWDIGDLQYYTCQSHEIGNAPMFTVIEKSKKAFVQTMKARLNEIGRAEQPLPHVQK